MMDHKELLSFRTKQCVKKHCDFGLSHSPILRRCPFYVSRVENSDLRYVPVPCPFMFQIKSIECPSGERCPYAHSFEEINYHPVVYKTLPCDGKSTDCALVYDRPSIPSPRCADQVCCWRYHSPLDKRTISTNQYRLPFTSGMLIHSFNSIIRVVSLQDHTIIRTAPPTPSTDPLALPSHRPFVPVTLRAIGGNSGTVSHHTYHPHVVDVKSVEDAAAQDAIIAQEHNRVAFMDPPPIFPDSHLGLVLRGIHFSTSNKSLRANALAAIFAFVEHLNRHVVRNDNNNSINTLSNVNNENNMMMMRNVVSNSLPSTPSINMIGNSQQILTAQGMMNNGSIILQNSNNNNNKNINNSNNMMTYGLQQQQQQQRNSINHQPLQMTPPNNNPASSHYLNMYGGGSSHITGSMPIHSQVFYSNENNIDGHNDDKNELHLQHHIMSATPNVNNNNSHIPTAQYNGVYHIQQQMQPHQQHHSDSYLINFNTNNHNSNQYVRTVPPPPTSFNTVHSPAAHLPPSFQQQQQPQVTYINSSAQVVTPPYNNNNNNNSSANNHNNNSYNNNHISPKNSNKNNSAHMNVHTAVNGNSLITTSPNSINMSSANSQHPSLKSHQIFTFDNSQSGGGMNLTTFPPPPLIVLSPSCNVNDNNNNSHDLNANTNNNNYQFTSNANSSGAISNVNNKVSSTISSGPLTSPPLMSQ